ncbi:MAG: metallophosphoesterase [Thermomicrobium sp.]|nr:metallophosphoesterase [Thermomicrobium sp.]
MAMPKRQPRPEDLEVLATCNDLQAAARLGVAVHTVRRWRREFGIPNPYLVARGLAEGRVAREHAAEVRDVVREALERPARRSWAGELVVMPPECEVRLRSDTTVVVLADLHLPEADPDALALAETIVRDLAPDVVVLNGDLLDVYALTSWPRSPERRSFATEVERVRAQIAAVARWAPDARWIWLHGNHEQRFVRYLWRHAAELWQLDDLDLGRIVRVPEDWVVLPTSRGTVGDTRHRHRRSGSVGCTCCTATRSAVPVR